MNSYELGLLVVKQLNSLFSVEDESEKLLENEIGGYFQDAYICTQECMKHFRTKYFNGQINPYNSVMYCIYLYWLSRRMYLGNQVEIADKVYYLNKTLNGNDIFYAVKLPQHWGCEHPVASVLGRAIYGDSFYFYQGCTVGGNINGTKIMYPQIGEQVTMFSGAKILGDSRIGNNVVLSANTYVINEEIPDNSIVFGSSPNLAVKQNRKTQQQWLGLSKEGNQ